MTAGLPDRLTEPLTFRAPLLISASSAELSTGKGLLDDTLEPADVIETELLVPPEPLPKLHGVTCVPLGQKMVIPG